MTMEIPQYFDRFVFCYRCVHDTEPCFENLDGLINLAGCGMSLEMNFVWFMFQNSALSN